MGQDGEILYLNGKEVEHICQQIDSVAAMHTLFELHGKGQTVLPDEAYLVWTNGRDEKVRSLNMPGFIGEPISVAGTKIINSNRNNPSRGFQRASGVTLLFDEVSTRITSIMEGAFISSLRTASVTALAIETLSEKAITDLAIIGAGVLAQAHIEVLVKRLPALQRIFLFDIDDNRRKEVVRKTEVLLREHHISLENAPVAEAVRSAQVIIPVTTTTTGYIPFEWLQPGALVSHVSLDDVLPDVVFQADVLVVDDWNLVKNDETRLLGKMVRQGQLVGPDDVCLPGNPLCRKVDAQLGDILVGKSQGRRAPEDIILFNPFGLAIEDLLLANLVYQAAIAQGLGMMLER